MAYIVPAEDKFEGHFFVPISGRTRIALPLESNTLAVLRPLGKWLGIKESDRLRKSDLISVIPKWLSFLPMEDAVSQWPVLGHVLQRLAAPESLVKAEVEQLLKKMREITLSIKSTPQFAPHWYKICDELEGHKQRIAAEERRAIQEARESRPAWWAEKVKEAPTTGPHFAIEMEKVEQGHDGYCTGTEQDELETVNTKTYTVFLPDGDWDFSKTEWRRGLAYHCCCGADMIWRVVSVKKME